MKALFEGNDTAISARDVLEKEENKLKAFSPSNHWLLAKIWVRGVKAGEFKVFEYAIYRIISLLRVSILDRGIKLKQVTKNFPISFFISTYVSAAAYTLTKQISDFYLDDEEWISVLKGKIKDERILRTRNTKNSRSKGSNSRPRRRSSFKFSLSRKRSQSRTGKRGTLMSAIKTKKIIKGEDEGAIESALLSCKVTPSSMRKIPSEVDRKAVLADYCRLLMKLGEKAAQVSNDFIRKFEHAQLKLNDIIQVKNEPVTWGKADARWHERRPKVDFPLLIEQTDWFMKALCQEQDFKSWDEYITYFEAQSADKYNRAQCNLQRDYLDAAIDMLDQERYPSFALLKPHLKISPCLVKWIETGDVDTELRKLIKKKKFLYYRYESENERFLVLLRKIGFNC